MSQRKLPVLSPRPPQPYTPADEVEAWLRASLRQQYDGTVHETLPDSLLRLLTAD